MNSIAEIRVLLSSIPAGESEEGSDEWTLEKAVRALQQIRSWADAEHRRLNGAPGLGDLEAELTAIVATEPGVLATRARSLLLELGAGKIAAPEIGWHAYVESARANSAIPDSLERIASRIKWLQALETICKQSRVESRPVAPASGIPSVAVAMSGDLRLQVRRAADALRELSERTDGSRWGLDFGTSQSKLVLSPPNQPLAANSPTFLEPSVVAIHKSNDRIRFGSAAVEAGQDWNRTTSLKRLLVGKRMNQPSAHKSLTTERLTILYVAWMLHRAALHRGGVSIAHDFGLSYPVVSQARQSQLRAPMNISSLSSLVRYDDWLAPALRCAQLVALALEGRPWPEEQASLVELLDVIDQDFTMPGLGLPSYPETLSEPAAALGAHPPPQLVPGLTMLVDCGAGTTDVSVFLAEENAVRIVAETSEIAGGDTLDEAIAQAVGKKLGRVFDIKEHGVWLRDSKLLLLSDKRLTVDPEELGLSGSRFDIGVGDIADGFATLRKQVGEIVRQAVVEAKRVLYERRAKKKGSGPPEFKKVWMLGGSSVVQDVVDGIKTGLSEAGVHRAPESFALPPDYRAWAPEKYRPLAVAIGASRPRGTRPEPWDPPPRRISQIELADKESV